MAYAFKRLLTGFTLVGSLPTVGSLMSRQVRFLCKFFLTCATPVRFLARMDSFVIHKVIPFCKRLLANLTTEWFLHRVSPHVNP
uniref:Putative secreted protein n=1 Tax=Ixodes ricinus TaxID=34613 RepID=A0A147BT67_IXORI